MIVAVDYDETLAINDNYGETIFMNEKLIEALKFMQTKGHKVILWTCREGKWLIEAVEKCKQYELFFDAINENYHQITHDSCCQRKIFADIYIDDRAKSVNEFLADYKEEI